MREGFAIFKQDFSKSFCELWNSLLRTASFLEQRRWICGRYLLVRCLVSSILLGVFCVPSWRKLKRCVIEKDNQCVGSICALRRTEYILSFFMNNLSQWKTTSILRRLKYGVASLVCYISVFVLECKPRGSSTMVYFFTGQVYYEWYNVGSMYTSKNSPVCKDINRSGDPGLLL